MARDPTRYGKPGGRQKTRKGGQNTARKLNYQPPPTETVVNPQIGLEEVLRTAIAANEAYFSNKPNSLKLFEGCEALYKDTMGNLPYQMKWNVTEEVFLDRLAILKAHTRSRLENTPLEAVLAEEYTFIANSAHKIGDSATAKAYLSQARVVYERFRLPMSSYLSQWKYYEHVRKEIYNSK